MSRSLAKRAYDATWGRLFATIYDRTLAATEAAGLGDRRGALLAGAKLWRIEQLPDGSWRLLPKSVPAAKEPLALSAIGASSATLARSDPADDRQRWRFVAEP